MSRAKLTPAIAHAAGWDAGNARMKAAGRKKWNRADANHAARVEEKLLIAAGWTVSFYRHTKSS